MRVLVVDDEQRLATALVRGLRADGFEATAVHDGPAGLEAARRGGYDAVVLDLMLPGLSGYEVLRRLRRSDDRTPVLVLSAKDGEYDLADAFELGADDYLVKPFSYVVLQARLRALDRRTRRQRSRVLASGRVSLDLDRREAGLDGHPVALTPRELALLEQLLRAGGAVVSKVELLERVFGHDPDAHPNVVEVYVGYLRRKLGRDAVVTVRGGYRVGTP